MVLSGEKREKSPMTPPGIDPGIVRLVAQCLNHYATPARNLARHKLDVAVVVEFRWDKRGAVRREDYIFFCYQNAE